MQLIDEILQHLFGLGYLGADHGLSYFSCWRKRTHGHAIPALHAVDLDLIEVVFACIAGDVALVELHVSELVSKVVFRASIAKSLVLSVQALAFVAVPSVVKVHAVTGNVVLEHGAR